MMPTIERHRKSPKKDMPVNFLYSHMVHLHRINRIEDHYTLQKPIGKGSSATVYRAVANHIPHVRAIKHIRKE